MKSSLTIFPIATTYPSFFNTNLVDPHRVIKLSTGKYCTILAFYYQTTYEIILTLIVFWLAHLGSFFVL